MPQVKVKTESLYQNHSIAKNKAIKLILKAPYHEMKNYLGTIQLVNENTEIAVRIGSDKKPFKLGSYTFQSLGIDKDGNAKITWLTQIEFAEMDNLTVLAARNDEPQTYLFKADVQVDEEDYEEVLEEE